MTAIQQVAVAFRVSIKTIPHPSPGPECLEAAFKSEADLATMEFAWRRAMGDSLERLFREVRSGHFSIKVATLGSDQGDGFTSRRYRIESACGNETSRERGATKVQLCPGA